MKKLLISALLTVGFLAFSGLAKADDDLVNIFSDGVDVSTLTGNTNIGFVRGPVLVTSVFFSSNAAGIVSVPFVSLFSTDVDSFNTLSQSPAVYTSTYPATEKYRIYADSGTENDASGTKRSGTVREFKYPKYFPRGLSLRASVSTYNLIGVEYIKSRVAGQPYP